MADAAPRTQAADAPAGPEGAAEAARAAEAADLTLGTVVVMLDGHLHCRELATTHPDTVIHWGAYVGMPQQELRSGRLADVIDEIVQLRADLRATHGWVMDVYALTPA